QFKSRYKAHRELVGRFMVFRVLGTIFNARWLCMALICPLREIQIKKPLISIINLLRALIELITELIE
ncbi:hypothetical protein, partial [Staphylococcus simulans]|uniref:hypothetical protein n=1 Tax=Staphylococcus simulans TaxID=1286 RepID=UPI001F167B1B